MKNILQLALILFFLPNVNAQILTESNLPILVITTENGEEIPDEPKITAHLGIIDNGDGAINSIEDSFNDYNGQIGIEMRGQTSQLFPKKPYGFETRLEDGSNNNVSIVNFPAENDWVLHNPFSDKTLIRNAFVYKLAEQIMDYAPRTRMVEVIVNEEYRGIYLLTEKIKRDNDRVDIAKLDEDDIAGDSLTGGYIIKIDKFNEGDWGFISLHQPPNASENQFIGFLFHEPKADEITDEQTTYITDFMNGFENALTGDDFTDAQTGYRQYIDVSTFIDFLLINEVSRNVDGYRISTYLYKDKDSNDPFLKMGPVWDFNIAMGNADYCNGGSTEGWAFDFNSVCNEDFWLVPFWWHRLLEDPYFGNRLRLRWEELRNNQFSDERLNIICDSLASVVEEASVRNYEKYDEVLGNYIWPNNFVGNTWQEEIDYMCGWMNDRVEWIDENLSEIVDVNDLQNEWFEPRVFPNISSSIFTFSFYLEEHSDVKIQIFDTQGRLVDEIKNTFLGNGENELIWDKNVEHGMYFYSLKIGGEEKIFSGKIVKI